MTASDTAAMAAAARIREASKDLVAVRLIVEEVRCTESKSSSLRSSTCSAIAMGSGRPIGLMDRCGWQLEGMVQ
eukprot:scaffold60079_cov27-Prasinocladus_malaysianus.AAC.1